MSPFRADPAGSAIFSDFDGTLAHVVDDPAAAAPLPGVVDELARLAARYGRVGVVSGRPASFLRSHLGGRGLLLSGLYGLELVADDGSIVTVPEAERWRAAVEEVVARAGVELPPGLAVECKGLSVTIHYRTAPAQLEMVGEWVEGQARATGLVAHAARMSYELRVPVELDKGTALAAAAHGHRQVCFLGDDRGDLSAFAALDAMAGAGATVVKVGVISPEAPPAIIEQADLVVEGPEGSLRFLRAFSEAPEGR